MRGYPRMIVVAAVVLTALLAVLFDAASAADNRSRPSTTMQMVVPSQRGWTQTPLSLNQSEHFTVRAHGSVGWQPRRKRVSPNGLPFSNYLCASGQYSGNPFEAAGLNCWSLIGRIGSNNVPFLVGKSFKLKSPTSGRLYLGFNDDTYSDNSGHFFVTISTP